MQVITLSERDQGLKVTAIVRFDRDMLRDGHLSANGIARYFDYYDEPEWQEDGGYYLNDRDNVLVTFSDGRFGVVSEDALDAALEVTGQSRALRTDTGR